MEPFSIACTTCQARLRVRDESVIGQILTCPKCDSMVLVEPPPPEPLETEAAAPVSEPAAAPPGDFADTADWFDQPAGADEPASPDPSEFADTVEDISVQGITSPRPTSQAFSHEKAEPTEDQGTAAEGTAAEGTAAEGTAAEGTAAELEPADVEADVDYDPASLPERPLLPNADWTSQAATAWRNRALTVVAVVVGVVLAVMASVLFNGAGDSPPSPAIAQHDPGASEPLRPSDDADAAQEPDDVASPDPNEPSAVEPPGEPVTEPPGEPGPAVEQVPPAVAADDLQGGQEFGQASAHAAAPASTGDAVPLPDELPTDEPPTDEPPTDEPPTDEPPTDEPPTDEPPAGEPTPEQPSEGPPGLVAAADPPETADDEDSVAKTIREFGELLGSPAAASSDVAEAEGEPEVAPPDDSLAEAEGATRPGARVVDVDARLRDPIAAIEFEKIPLKNFLRFISDYSTIPVTLDADALVWAKITPVTHINVAATESTVSDVLTEAIAPLGLYYRIEREQLFVTRRPKNETGLRTVRFPVSDLAGDDEELQRLGEMIVDLVEPDSWTQRGGVGSLNYEGTTLVLKQEEPVLFEVLSFCQKLRTANGLEVRGRYAPSIFRLDTRTARARRRLAQPISLTYIRPAPFQRIVDRISETARIQILIDWRTLAEVDWSPDAEVALTTAGEPLSDALVKLLQPMDLTYRVVSGSVLQITTQEACDARLEVELYRIGSLLDEAGEAKVVQDIYETLGRDHFRTFGGDSQVTIDPKSKCLLACMPQKQQVLLEQWLIEQAGAKAAAAAGGAAVGATIPTAAGEFRIAPVSDPVSND